MKDYSSEFEKLFYKEGTKQELQAIQQKINNSPALMKEYKEYLALMNHIGKRERVNHSLKVLNSIHQRETAPKKNTTSVKILGLLGFILLSFMLFMFLNKKSSKSHSPKEIYAAYYEKPIIDLNQRSNQSTNEGLQFYEADQFEKALNNLDTSGVLARDHSLIMLAKTIAIHETQSLENSQKAFDSLSSSYPSLNSTITWFRAMNFLKHGQLTPAKELLKDIDESSFYYKKANTILKSLD